MSSYQGDLRPRRRTWCCQSWEEENHAGTKRKLDASELDFEKEKNRTRGNQKRPRIGKGYDVENNNRLFPLMCSFNFTQHEREGEREKPTFVAVIYWFFIGCGASRYRSCSTFRLRFSFFIRPPFIIQPRLIRIANSSIQGDSWKQTKYDGGNE